MPQLIYFVKAKFPPKMIQVCTNMKVKCIEKPLYNIKVKIHTQEIHIFKTMMVPFFIAGLYKYRNKEIHVHVLAKEKNNAQNYINIKSFLLY